MAKEYRIEHDLLGEKRISMDSYYGIQTLRAKDNFSISKVNLSQFPKLIRALAQVKKACAMANNELGLLDDKLCDAICSACDEIVAKKYHDQFIVDVIQGGAGTSTNMNANEVITNVALEIMGYEKGRYDILHPNNHVNMSQSTNDVYPTAVRLALYEYLCKLQNKMQILKDSFFSKAKEFNDIIKMGRTQLQDAVPMTLGQEFNSFGLMIEDDISAIEMTKRIVAQMNLGATAIGTGINTDSKYAGLVKEKLEEVTNRPFVTACDLVKATQDTSTFVQVSGVMKSIATKISKICNDLRLLSSGPRTGINEINLPKMQPGSSIMPGKVNPVIPEVVNQVAFQVIGHDITISLASEGGQLQLNVFEPIIAYNLFQSITMMCNASETLAFKCVDGITANEQRCKELVLNSIGLVTALNPYIGYQNATLVAKEALETNRSVYDIVLEKKLLSKEQLDEYLKPENMTHPTYSKDCKL
ncbi:aspartate ammonia-lyase [Malaciobacter halophilus]|uniref:Aspartate ammonia-lyase n=1 Tax=Malaciobacter halophilus TaxID=197482 RepID=A0A2N1J0X4_9BACT|nr:aspartate ammonia-lyase [Malaciobacter halophilus]AXH09472.1 aspartate ammonia-lyase [Malaciobacter halophilus]PKI80218.1 aspartate ammonia-lyase [Malaciobacter halophilus]